MNETVSCLVVNAGVMVIIMNPLTKARANVRKWQIVGSFFAQRASDYAELATIELAETKATLLRELVAMVVLAVGILFTLSFLCFALIATALGTPYFLAVVWAIAAVWLMVSVGAFFALRVQLGGASHFVSLQDEFRKDMEVIKEAL